MTTITPTQTQTSPVTAANATAMTGGNSNISADFETFLKMLTVQMQNQDPLNPVDSSDYATQLATFSGVEQQVQTNDLLRALTGQMNTGGLMQLAGWVGMDARAPVPAYFDGAPVTVVPNVQRGADAAQLVVRDADGIEIQRLTIATDNAPVTWAGVTTDGAPLPRGFYAFDTVSLAAGEVVAEAPSEIYARVTEVQVTGGVNTLILAGGKSVPASQVTAVREAS
ncbi:flagellar hook capping FlgD N-terminal domain-containing protein [Loktanella sp. M215]|uniref:flagellar hook capping FlgD N-terminal domain-containing protein n=1 Tax=Loktanella sp. M215 TaxID=2675431 RepID=UPI001F165CE4|nr:flagellar hook capping FlgD N-terminal domain-containing protein [Loktanella sp. M215]MCF7698858.1 flagellar basal body rod modification protein [Loktanella sp. M215]